MGTQDMLFECWTTTAALLRDTRRIRVGQLVTCNGYRNPALQAKMASTLDVISGGRLTFGLGAGWWEPDYRAYGYEYPGTAERLRRLEEAAQVILALWTEDTVTFDGRYYQVKDAINQPKGIQRPHVPLMIAGGGEKVTLKLVARYGDLCNLTDDPATIERKLAVLRKHCADAGRDYASIRKTAMTLCIIGETDAEAAALDPPWAPPGVHRRHRPARAGRHHRHHPPAAGRSTRRPAWTSWRSPSTTHPGDIIRAYASAFLLRRGLATSGSVSEQGGQGPGSVDRGRGVPQIHGNNRPQVRARASGAIRSASASERRRLPACTLPRARGRGSISVRTSASVDRGENLPARPPSAGQPGGWRTGARRRRLPSRRGCR